MPHFCINCKWFIPSEFSTEEKKIEYSKCRATEKYNLVSGEPSYLYCSTARESISHCGPDGKLYEPNISDDVILINEEEEQATF